MNNTETAHYQKIVEAIDYLKIHFKQQPSLEELANVVGISPFHLQRLFTQWAGVSPKQFIHYLSLEHAKELLKKGNASVLSAALDTGLSGSGRLHDLFIKLEAMTPGEYKNGGQSLTIRYHHCQSAFGPLMIAATDKGICHLAFEQSATTALAQLQQGFPNAHLQASEQHEFASALAFFNQDWSQRGDIKLHVQATNFQIKVWQVLLTIPAGQLTSYGSIAQQIGKPKAARAVGTAIGSNPVAMLIPCHRVIQASGNNSGYRWGLTRKSALIAWESALTVS